MTAAEFPGRLVAIGEASRISGISIEALRYYEAEGLTVTAILRSPAGHRRYRPIDLEWFACVTILRGTGMSIAGIRAYAELARGGPDRDADRLALMDVHRTAVLHQLDAVRRNLDAITEKIAYYLENPSWHPLDPPPPTAPSPLAPWAHPV